ncbi:unnamed protein product [Microthlaspi erraticum]|uniref:Integrase catalytic domain-containing protein n=1 Tax=Microthlaspi erraticum TaxID=1685480 RepID=A0A6D2HJM6_9BRAS|nr:unnamed protein product [Microthlaspi erraticum]
MQGSSHQVIPIFNGEKYDFWSIKMATILRTRKLWSVVVEGVPPEPVQGEETPASQRAKTLREEAVTNDTLALQILQTAVTDQIFSRIAAASTSKKAWDALKDEYEGSPQVRLVKLQSLRREYENLKMYDGDDIKTFTDKLVVLENQLTYHGEKKSSSQLIQKILISLPAKFDSIVSVLEQTRDLDSLTMSELIGILKAQEARVAAREESTNEGAFYVRSKGRESGFKKDNTNSRVNQGKKWCEFCKRGNHTEEECRSKPKKNDQSKNQKSNVECYKCGRIGHYAHKCRSKNKERAHVSIEEEDLNEDHMLFSASEEEPTTLREDVWLVDSGCTNHMTKEERYFSSINKSVKVPIRVGNGDIVMTVGKGDITVMTNHGKRIIKNVFLVPGLEKNLLSVPQIFSSGYQVRFEDKRCIIHDANGKKIMDIGMTNKSFKIKLSSVEEEAMTANVHMEETWHKRLGHVGKRRLQEMQDKDLVKGLPSFKVEKEACKACNLGKQSRKSFPKESQTKTKEKLEIVHTDVCGPMQNQSIDGSRYYVLFLDDYTHMCWVYFLKQKSETFLKFKKFKAMVEKQSGCVIKTLRSDGGGEFTSHEFNRFCEEEGINRQVTLPYSPQQNGAAERKNRSLVEMARSMIVEQDLPLKLWAEAVYTSTYLQNRLPTKAIEDDVTPMEKWCGHKPNVSHLRLFGSICYVHIPDQKRRKLDAKAKRGILIGYSNQTKGYRVFILEDEKVEVSRDVIFEEDKKWDWEKQEVKKNFFLPINEAQEPRDQSNDRGTNGEGASNNINDQVDQVSDAFNQLQISEEEGQNSGAEGDSSTPPRKFKSMKRILEKAPRLVYEEADQVIEDCLLAHEEPQTYDEACGNEEWEEAMKEEIEMIEKNKTWKLVDKPEKKNVISVKWIYKIKTYANGNHIKHKARLVARGFSQEYGVDYLETFAPVSRHDTIRALLAYAAQMEWRLYQMDVKSAFLNGELEEEVYITQPPGFVIEGKEEKVLRLYKALYGLKQAPRAWYGRIDSYFIQNGFERSMNDAALYIKKKGGDVLIVSLYVDDIIITGNNVRLINSFKENMKNEFEMTDLGLLNYFLGMEVNQDDRGIFLSQEKYANKLIDKFGMKESKSVSTPLTPQGKREEDGIEYGDPTKYRSIVGGLLYLCASRPDVMYASSYLSRYMSSPHMKHYQEAKRVLRYVKGTSSFGVLFKSAKIPRLIGYSDSDWGGSIEDKKSTTGYVFSLGSAMFCWQSCKQQTVAQSTAEAEYIAVCAATNQAIWLQRLFEDFGLKFEEGIPILCDNKSAIAIGRNPVQHRRTKHIEIKYHFVREAEHKGLIQLEYCKGEDQLADILTKALSVSRFEELRKKLGVKPRYD